MKDIRVDAQGQQRCWNCGGVGFTEKRTARSKVLVGVGTFVTKKKLKCQSCGEYNDTGSAKPFTGPADKKKAKKLGTDALVLGTPAPQASRPAPASTADQLTKLAALRDQGVLTEEEFAAQKANLLG
jgi:hypothetical protein